jgi:putative flippase GtrA
MAVAYPVRHGASLPTVRDRSSGSSEVDYAALPIHGAPMTYVNSSPNNVEGSQEITTASALPRTNEGGNPPADLKFLNALFPNLSPARRVTLQRFVRYGSVSAISTVTTLAILGTLVGAFGYPAIWSNVIATAIGTIPSFELNRRWVWAHNQRSILRQALPYVALSFFGLLVSTYAVHLASDATIHSSRLVHTCAAELANAAAYGSLWFVQFFLCDRILFRSSKAGATSAFQAPASAGSVNAAAAAAPSAATVPA